MHKTLWISAAIVLGMATTTAIAQEYKWDFANDYQANSLPGEGDQYFGDLLSEKTDGNVEITFHFGGALGYNSSQMLDAIGSGALPMGDASSAFYSGADPIFVLPTLPFFAAQVDEMETLFDIIRPEVERRLEGFGHKLLFVTPWTPSGIWANKAIDSTGALEGLKIRTYDANSSLVFKELGAAPVQMSWGDVIPQLSTGGIDAVLTSDEGGVSAKFWDHLSHFTAVGYANALNITSMNIDLYESLPEDIRSAIDEAAAETQAHQWEQSAGRVERNFKIMRENGMTVVTEVPAELEESFAEAAVEPLQVWLEKMGEEGRALVDRYREALASN